MAQTMLAELFRRRVFSAPDDLGQVFAGTDAARGEPSIA
jgi:hypothetical protein